MTKTSYALSEVGLIKEVECLVNHWDLPPIEPIIMLDLKYYLIIFYLNCSKFERALIKKIKCIFIKWSKNPSIHIIHNWKIFHEWKSTFEQKHKTVGFVQSLICTSLMLNSLALNLQFSVNFEPQLC